MRTKRWTVTVALLLGLGAAAFCTEQGDDGGGTPAPDCQPWLSGGAFRGAQPTDRPFKLPVAMVPTGGRFEGKEPEFLYVSDAARHAIYRITKTSGGIQVTTLVGTADQNGFADTDDNGNPARFDTPSGITVDHRTGYGDIVYVADTNNKAVREIDPQTGQVHTLLGGPDQDVLSLPLGVAFGIIDEDEQRLAVADYGQNAVLILDPLNPATPLAMLPFQGPKRVDWWAPLSDDAGPPPHGMWGELVVATDTGIYRVRQNENGDFVADPNPIARDTNVTSVFGDDKGNIYYTTEDNSLKAIRRRPGLDYAQPMPLKPCGMELNSPTSLATFFGQLIVADQANTGSRLNVVVNTSSGLSGLNSTCSRCGILTPR